MCVGGRGLWLQLDYAHQQRSRAKQAIYESISYHDTILGRIWEGAGGGGRKEREEEGYVHYSITFTD